MVFERVNASGGIQGQKIELIMEDDQGQPTVAVNAAKKLVYKDDALVVIGTPMSATTLAALEVTMEAKVPQVALAVAPKITEMNNPWVVRLTPIDSILAGHLVNFAVKVKNLKQFGVLHDSSDYGKGGLASVTQALSAHNLKPVIVESFNVDDKDFSSQLNKIKKSGADGLMIWGLYVQGAQIITQSKQLGLSMPIFGSSGMLQANFLELAKGHAEGAYFVSYFSVDNPDPKVQAFVKQYRERFKSDPTPGSGITFEVANLLVNALNKVGQDRSKIIAEMRSTKDYMGVTGRLSADDKGDLGRGGVILEIKDSKPVMVWDAK